jgi:sulfhydrogenase subunit beta (sulfur reductase)
MRFWGCCASGYTLLGPTVRSQAIVYDEIASVADLPAGWTDDQEGVYRLRRRADEALFGHNVGPSSWKGFLFPSELRLVRVHRSDDGSVVAEAGDGEVPRYAFIGARSCDLTRSGGWRPPPRTS